MDQNQVQRIMQVCFQDKSPDLSHSQRPPNHKSFYSSNGGVSSPSDSMRKLKTRSVSRTLQIEDKILSQSANQIKRQPSQVLKTAGAYRNLRKSIEKSDTSNPRQERRQDVETTVNDSTVLHGSPEKSFISHLRKSASRSKSRTNTG